MSGYSQKALEWLLPVNWKKQKKKLKSLFPFNIETGAVGSVDGARYLSVPRNSIHWVRVMQGPAVLAIGVGEGCSDIFSLLYRFSSLHLSPGDGSIKTGMLPQWTVKPKTTNQYSTVGVSVYLGYAYAFFV